RLHDPPAQLPPEVQPHEPPRRDQPGHLAGPDAEHLADLLTAQHAPTTTHLLQRSLERQTSGKPLPIALVRQRLTAAHRALNPSCPAHSSPMRVLASPRAPARAATAETAPGRQLMARAPGWLLVKP